MGIRVQTPLVFLLLVTVGIADRITIAADLAATEASLEIGSRRELFVDQTLISKLTGGASLKLHRPSPQEVIFVTDQPWEGNTCAYYTMFQDGDIYRMYYRASHWDVEKKKATHPEFTCYAESRDGIHWVKPNLGLVEFQGSRANNIIWSGIGTHNFTPFRDENPNAPRESRYKALGVGNLPKTADRPARRGLFAFESPDGIHWQMVGDAPVITKGAFDSQNLAFWDPVRKLYVDYHRNFVNGVRNVMTCTSQDFVTWTDPVNLDFQSAPAEHLYTNTIRRYHRAPHLLIGFPTRYQPRTQQVEPIFMSSRDGHSFHRWPEAVIPITAPAERDGNRCNYMTYGLLSLPGRDKEMSVYASEAYYEGPDSRLRRFSYRVDGMTSLHADGTTGTFLSKPVIFEGNSLELNFATRPGGSVQVGLATVTDIPSSGLRLNDCKSLSGDSISQRVTWKSPVSLADLQGKPVRIQIQLQDADVYSFRFHDAARTNSP